LKLYLYIGIGGIIGSIARYLVSSIPLTTMYPFQTFFINIIGSFILGWFTTFVIEGRRIPPEFCTAIGTGVVGSFTTLSTFSMDTIHLLENELYTEAFIYILSSSVLGILVAYMGMCIGRFHLNKGREKNA
jgi:CrcB protein